MLAPLVRVSRAGLGEGLVALPTLVRPFLGVRPHVLREVGLAPLHLPAHGAGKDDLEAVGAARLVGTIVLDHSNHLQCQVSADVLKYFVLVRERKE